MNKSDPSKKTPPEETHPAHQSYAPGDPIPVPDVTESDTDTAWHMFEELAEPKPETKPNSDGFADTIPADFEPDDQIPPHMPLKK